LEALITWIEASDGENGKAVGGIDEDEATLHVQDLQQKPLLQTSVEPGIALNLNHRVVLVARAHLNITFKNYIKL
jgi:hypothetical protein